MFSYTIVHVCLYIDSCEVKLNIAIGFVGVSNRGYLRGVTKCICVSITEGLGILSSNPLTLANGFSGK